ncbi:hypothetical protein EK599_10850 [Vibrio sp. T187]|uniref:hypothetical protein n=1 Tax=Vibrio TaxID=662 RepID=UPI0010C9B536|nr:MULTISPECIES: hypothetical protein [Vibrio]MBW3696198.1 hypothetical protein [Vibrio sp. T187]
MALISLLFLAACTSTPKTEPEVQMVVETQDSESLKEQAVQTELEHEPDTKGIDGHVILDNEPAKLILNSIESVADTLNVLSFGIFAAGRTRF